MGNHPAPCTGPSSLLRQGPCSPKQPGDPSSAPLSTQAGPPRRCPAPGATDPVEFLLVAEERVVAAVLALPVFGNEEAPPLLAAAGRGDGLAGGHVGSPELVGHGIADLVEELRGQGEADGTVLPGDGAWLGMGGGGFVGLLRGSLLGQGGGDEHGSRHSQPEVAALLLLPGRAAGCGQNMEGKTGGSWGPRVGRVQEHPPTAGTQGCSLPSPVFQQQRRLSPGVWQPPPPPTPLPAPENLIWKAAPSCGRGGGDAQHP